MNIEDKNKNVNESNSNLIDFKNFLTKIDKSVVEFDFDFDLLREDFFFISSTTSFAEISMSFASTSPSPS